MAVEKIILSAAAIFCIVILGYLVAVIRKEMRRSDGVVGKIDDAKFISEAMLSALDEQTRTLKEIKEILEKK